jgi:putative tryptophan/tyrosine transport system substrate-binding protein
MKTVLLLIGFFLGSVNFAEAQQAAKIVRIGFLDSGNAAAARDVLQALRQELSKLGWVEGKNITIEYRFAEQNNERLPELAANLVGLMVDLIVVAGNASALAAKSVTSNIPIVMTNVADPVGLGLVGSLAQPGANVTGSSSLAPELNTKRLEILKDVVPNLTRVGLLRPPGSLQLKELTPAALSLKLKLEEIETRRDAKDLESAFQIAKKKQVNGIMTTVNRIFFAERKQIVELAGKNRLPAIYFEQAFMDEGGLMSYGVEYYDLYRRAAGYVDKILKGAKPADLPVQQATKFELVINLKAAKQIGLAIPANVLARADRVIK